MPTNYPAIIFGSLPLITGGPDPTKPNHSYQRFESELYCQRWPELLGVDHSNLECVIEHYVSEGEATPMENALVYCSGTFQVVVEDEQLLVKIKTIRLQSYPGDIDSDDYIEGCPAPMPIQANLIGIVGQTVNPNLVTNVALRSIEIKTYVWDAVEKSISFTVAALFPNTPRWQNTPMPRRGALVSVTGDIIGKKESGNQIVMLIQAFSFIDVRGTEVATQGSIEASKESAPSTPRKTKWMTWQSKPNSTNNSPLKTSPGKKRPREVVDLEENSQSVASPSKHNRRSPSLTSNTVTENTA